MSATYLWGVIRRAVEGRFKVVFFATTLPPLKVVTVTFATGVFLVTALGVAFAVVEVLRVLRFFGAVAFGVVETGVDLTGIRIDSCVYSLIIPNKKPLLRGLLHTLTKKSSLLTVLSFREW